MTTLTRRRSRRDDEPEEETQERPSRRRRKDEDSGEDETPRRRRRKASSDEDEDEPHRERPRRRGGDSRASRGWSSYDQKKARTSDYANEFKPEDNEPTLIKVLDAEPFDSYVQHWIDDVPKGEPKSYMCFDDEYFEDEDDYDKGCPLCEIGEPGRTFSLFNILDMSNPRKPEVKVWVASPAVADRLKRASKNERTSPINREDVYFEVTKEKKKHKVEWVLAPIKARDLPDDFNGLEPLTAEEIEEFEKDSYTSRKGVTRVDSWESLDDLAQSLTD